MFVLVAFVNVLLEAGQQNGNGPEAVVFAKRETFIGLLRK
jgi:hypothetical protein